jgi:hypothetical protein
MVAVELEVLAKKFDRFGWERDRNTPAHDRLMVDWMDALQDYPLAEIRAACRAAILANPNRMPNEGHVVAMILDARRAHVAALAPRQAEAPARVPCSPDAAARIMAEVFGRDANPAALPADLAAAKRVAPSAEV